MAAIEHEGDTLNTSGSLPNIGAGAPDFMLVRRCSERSVANLARSKGSTGQLETAKRSTGWPVILAMSSKSLSRCRTVSRDSSAIAAMSRSGIDGAR